MLGITAVALVLPAGTLPAAPQDENKGDWKAMERESKRMKINEMADDTMAMLLEESDKAPELYEQAYGWAVFDNLKLALGISGGGGNGVAVNKGSGDRTYMKMGTAGIGLGLGGQRYQVVFLFQDEKTFTNFVESGWQADASAQAAAGTDSAEVKTGFVNGLAIYQFTEKGLIASADIAGTKYWKNKKLND
jgi:lipid-binding SYLF domain-containing protein